MPTQQEIEFWRNRMQRMTKERFYAANILALITHTLTQPFDMIKVRSIMLQEGKNYNNLGLHRGYNMLQIAREISKSGGGYKTWFTSYEGFAARTITYTTARIWAYLWFYDRLNKDPRRHARPDRTAMAGVAGGLVAGVVSNPIEIVFTRMQVDHMYGEGYRRNYKNFYDGLMKTSQEGALFRGAIANGLRIAGLISTATAFHDWFKENAYYFLGPHFINRFVATLVAAIVMTAASMPFDTIRTRLYTMRPLPNGVWPYKGFTDCLSKIARYEANYKNHGNYQSFYAGYHSYLARMFVIAYASQYFIDFYQRAEVRERLWVPAMYATRSTPALDVREPFTMAFHKGYIEAVTEGFEDTAAYHPEQIETKFV